MFLTSNVSHLYDDLICAYSSNYLFFLYFTMSEEYDEVEVFFTLEYFGKRYRSCMHQIFISHRRIYL